MKMRVLFLTVLVALLAVASATDLYAQKLNLLLYREGYVNGVQLGKGSYGVEVAPSLESVTFYRGRQAVTSAPCKVRMIDGPAIGDSVFYRGRPDGGEDIVKILLVGPGLVIEIAE